MKTIRGSFRAAVLMGAAAAVLAFTVGAKAQNRDSNDNQWQDENNPAPNDNPWPYNKLQGSPVLAVVGDIACQPGAPGTEVTGESSDELCTDSPGNGGTPEPLWQSQEATANQIETMKPDAVALLGDLQYQVGRYLDFEQSYDLTYGGFKLITRPAPGNHEFYNEHGEIGVAGYGYFSYFNGFQIDANGNQITTTIPNPCVTASSSCKAAGKGALPSTQPVPRQDGQAGHFGAAGDGWYSYNLGSWHIISLNIECYTQPGGCSATSTTPGTQTWFASELEWLKKDLEENHSACTAAYWHQPTFSPTDGVTQEGTTAQAFWQLLYQYGADLVLNGHDHLYARYRPLDPSGNPDPRRGIREFVVGTGGETLDPVVTTTNGTAASNPAGLVNFNAENLETPTGGTTAEGGQFWGVMALTLDPNGYKWDFESALPDLQQTTSGASFSDKGVGFCHGSPDHDHDH